MNVKDERDLIAGPSHWMFYDIEIRLMTQSLRNNLTLEPIGRFTVVGKDMNTIHFNEIPKRAAWMLMKHPDYLKRIPQGSVIYLERDMLSQYSCTCRAYVGSSIAPRRNQ